MHRFSRRIETPPCADQGVFDHSPVELLWKPTPIRRPRPRPAQPANDIRRPLPPWLTTDPTFKHLLARELDAWIPHRQQGGAGLSEFVDLVHTLGTDFLRGHLVEAVTTQHRMDVTAKVLYHLDARKAHAKTLAPLFSEGWDELLSDTYSASYSLGCRKWVVIPKESDVRTTEKLRDLELHNVTRKILARMCNRILDEVFRSQLHSSQQAFYSTGDISRKPLASTSHFSRLPIFVSRGDHFAVDIRL